ncbi:hypothetical protein GJ688_01955 [Heliobacillus mobilis]|uniref:DUF5626 domain-containing protein n=1 Tax=Heliobacterium mobile TaxID=28064 RepID=A0A6I3SFM7_HELMO|nr:hypothetical protein [Heliobacterium mobile]MTV47746.1 hypothetical protein [Heliobacterium mobile]
MRLKVKLISTMVLLAAFLSLSLIGTAYASDNLSVTGLYELDVKKGKMSIDLDSSWNQSVTLGKKEKPVFQWYIASTPLDQGPPTMYSTDWTYFKTTYASNSYGTWSSKLKTKINVKNILGQYDPNKAYWIGVQVQISPTRQIVDYQYPIPKN